MRFLKDLLVPHAGNVYRPGIFSRGWLAFFLALTLAAESFLIFNLFGRGAVENFIAAVVGSELVRLTNVERAHAGGNVLAENALLQAAAQAKAEDMAARGYFSHVGPDGKQPWAWIAEAGYDYQFAGENLAVRFVDSSEVVEAWMNSPTHRANIVKPTYEEIGIGVAQGTYKGASATFVVQFFGAPQAVARASVPPPPPPPAAAVQLPEASAASAVSPVEVAGEATEAAPGGASPASAQEAAPPPAPTFAESFAKGVARAFAEPRLATALGLAAIASALMLALALAFFINVQVQPTDLLLRGAAVALVPLLLIACNARLAAFSPSSGSGQGAAVGSLWESGGVEVGGGASTERFIVAR